MTAREFKLIKQVMETELRETVNKAETERKEALNAILLEEVHEEVARRAALHPKGSGEVFRIKRRLVTLKAEKEKLEQELLGVGLQVHSADDMRVRVVANDEWSFVTSEWGFGDKTLKFTKKISLPPSRSFYEEQQKLEKALVAAELQRSSIDAQALLAELRKTFLG